MVDEQILSKAQGGKAKAEKLKAVRTKELQVEKELDTGMSDYPLNRRAVNRRGQAEAGRERRRPLSKLDTAIASGRQYTGDLQTLIEDLTAGVRRPGPQWRQ
ncbi:MAG: hypothetical protein U0074_24450 [Kouleothrix sp.]